MIVIPDVRGRKFWRDIIEYKREGEKVVFLGNYMEPVPSDNINPDDAYSELLDIIQYKKENPEDVVLLLGKYDFACIDRNMSVKGHSAKNFKRDKSVFTDNANLFQLTYQDEIGKKKYLFSNAGVHKTWLSYLTQIFPYDQRLTLSENLNSYHRDYFDKFKNLLNLMSNYCGWSSEKYGSCIWAHVNEWKYFNDSADMGYYQVFCNTLLDASITGNMFCMLGIETGYRIGENNEIYKLFKIENNV